MISLEKCYSLRSSVQKNTQHNLSKSMLNGNEDILDKLDVIEHTLNTNEIDPSAINQRIEQSRFAYVLKTVESNIENLLEKIMSCHPSNSKSCYSFLKFSQPTEYSKKMNESLLERSSTISTPSITCEETTINSIFKLLGRADTAVASLTETLKQENKLRSDIKKKIDFGIKSSNHGAAIDYVQQIEDIKISHTQEINSLKEHYESKLRDIKHSTKEQIQDITFQYQSMLNKQLEQINLKNSENIDKMMQMGKDKESQINQLIEVLELKDRKEADGSNFKSNKSYKRMEDSRINVVEECYPINESSYSSSNQSKEETKSISSQKQQEEKYKKFMIEFSNCRKQEMDMFRSNQLLFVKNLQKEVEKLTNIVKSTNDKKSNVNEQSEDLQILDESI